MGRHIPLSLMVAYVANVAHSLHHCSMNAQIGNFNQVEVD